MQTVRALVANTVDELGRTGRLISAGKPEQLLEPIELVFAR